MAKYEFLHKSVKTAVREREREHRIVSTHRGDTQRRRQTFSSILSNPFVLCERSRKEREREIRETSTAYIHFKR